MGSCTASIMLRARSESLAACNCASLSRSCLVAISKSASCNCSMLCSTCSCCCAFSCVDVSGFLVFCSSSRVFSAAICANWDTVGANFESSFRASSTVGCASVRIASNSPSRSPSSGAALSIVSLLADRRGSSFCRIALETGPHRSPLSRSATALGNPDSFIHWWVNSHR